MSVTPTRWLRLSEVRQRLQNSYLRTSEIPIEHHVALPLPTRRWAGPGYAAFANPALRVPGQPTEMAAPDRWWVVSARGGGLVIYALAEALPFAEGIAPGPFAVPAPNRSLAELAQDLETIVELVDTLAPVFFDGQAADPRTRRALAEALTSHFAPPLLPLYRALVPDFFAWLEG